MPTLPQINCDAENISEGESLIENMFEKLKSDGPKKKETTSKLQESIEKQFDNQLSMFKAKLGKLIFKSYVNSMGYGSF